MFYRQSAFNSSRGLLGTRPMSFPKGLNHVVLEQLTLVCNHHGMTMHQGYRLIRIKVLIAQKIGGKWWVAQNPDCKLPLSQYTRGRYRARTSN